MQSERFRGVIHISKGLPRPLLWFRSLPRTFFEMDHSLSDSAQTLEVPIHGLHATLRRHCGHWPYFAFTNKMMISLLFLQSCTIDARHHSIPTCLEALRRYLGSNTVAKSHWCHWFDSLEHLHNRNSQF